MLSTVQSVICQGKILFRLQGQGTWEVSIELGKILILGNSDD